MGICTAGGGGGAAYFQGGVRGGEGAEGVSATGSEEPPLAASAAARGGRAQSMSATDLVAFGWGRLRPLGGDRRRGTVRLLRAAKMRPKTSGSDPLAM